MTDRAALPVHRLMIAGHRSPSRSWASRPSMMVARTIRRSSRSRAALHGRSSRHRSATPPTRTLRGRPPGSSGSPVNRARASSGCNDSSGRERAAVGRPPVHGGPHHGERVDGRRRGRRSRRRGVCRCRGTPDPDRARVDRPGRRCGGSGRRARRGSGAGSPPSTPNRARGRTRSGGTTLACSMRSRDRGPASARAVTAYTTVTWLAAWMATGRAASWAVRMACTRSRRSGRSRSASTILTGPMAMPSGRMLDAAERSWP